MTEEEIVALADTARDQYFLTAPDKLARLVAAAGIKATDHVVEVGAGVGTVATVLPSCASLTLIELDPRLNNALRANVPNAHIIQGDALVLLCGMSCDVLISNLPAAATELLIDLLPTLPPRVAVVAVREGAVLDKLKPEFSFQLITTVGGNDFQPSQPTRSQLMKITRIARL